MIHQGECLMREGWYGMTTRRHLHHGMSSHDLRVSGVLSFRVAVPRAGVPWCSSWPMRRLLVSIFVMNSARSSCGFGDKVILAFIDNLEVENLLLKFFDIVRRWLDWFISWRWELFFGSRWRGWGFLGEML